MKNLAISLFISVCIVVFSCRKDAQSERFRFLTTPKWGSDSLLANGADASGPDGILKNFKGEAKFNKDGTGYFGAYKGTWYFSNNESEIVIKTDSLPIPLANKIEELTSVSLKVTTSYSNPVISPLPIKIRMTFKAK
jgi:hypothetical protein